MRVWYFPLLHCGIASYYKAVRKEEVARRSVAEASVDGSGRTGWKSRQARRRARKGWWSVGRTRRREEREEEEEAAVCWRCRSGGRPRETGRLAAAVVRGRWWKGTVVEQCGAVQCSAVLTSAGE